MWVEAEMAMADFMRSSVSVFRVVSGSPDSVWALLTDWAGMKHWWPKDAVISFEDIRLVGSADAVPRTRIITVNDQFVEETLIVQNDLARRLYYLVHDGGLPGIENYLASTTVDALPEGDSKVVIFSQFDVAPGEDIEAAKAMLTAVYNTIADGIDGYLKKKIA